MACQGVAGVWVAAPEMPGLDRLKAAVATDPFGQGEAYRTLQELCNTQELCCALQELCGTAGAVPHPAGAAQHPTPPGAA